MKNNFFNHNKKKITEKFSFVNKYKWWFIITSAVLIVAYIFIFKYFDNVDEKITKSDCLNFLGAYLCFAGTLVVSLIAIFQSKYYVEKEKQRIRFERKKQIQPIVSVRIVDVDSQIMGTVEAFDLNKKEETKHKNVTIEFENVGEYPVLNVFILDNFWAVFKPNEKKQIQIAYSDLCDTNHANLTIIDETEYERTDTGIPKLFDLCYEDIDGNSVYKIYKLMNYGKVEYYYLEGTYDS